MNSQGHGTGSVCSSIISAEELIPQQILYTNITPTVAAVSAAINMPCVEI